MSLILYFFKNINMRLLLLISIGFTLSLLKATAQESKYFPENRGEIIKENNYTRSYLKGYNNTEWVVYESPTIISELSKIDQFHIDNIKLWKELNELEKQWVKDHGQLVVVVGAIYLRGPTKPSHIYKIIYKKDDNNPDIIAFCFENRSNNIELTSTIVTIKYLEHITNIKFFPSIPKTVNKALKKKTNFKNWITSRNVVIAKGIMNLKNRDRYFDDLVKINENKLEISILNIKNQLMNAISQGPGDPYRDKMIKIEKANDNIENNFAKKYQHNPLSAHLKLDNTKPCINSFPWPPPQYSTYDLIPNQYFTASSTLKDIDEQFIKALDNNGYTEKSYYEIPNGFALVTRMEQIRESGESLNPPDRWSSVPVSNFDYTLSSFFNSIFFSTTGHYRVIVLAVTDTPFTDNGEKPIKDKTDEWLKGKYKRLPSTIKNIKYSDEHFCITLIFEFSKPESGDPKFIKNPNLTGREHLQKSNILSSFTTNN